MKNLKNLMAAITLLAILVLGTGSANAGLIMSDFAGHQEDPCTESSPTKYDSGVIIAFTGVIIARFGIILTDKSNTTPVNCGILMSD